MYPPVHKHGTSRVGVPEDQFFLGKMDPFCGFHVSGQEDMGMGQKNSPPGIGPQVLVHVSIYQGSILGTCF